MVLCLGFGRYNNRRQIERNRNITQTFTVSFKLNLLEHLPCVTKLSRKTITPLQNLSILVLFFPHPMLPVNLTPFSAGCWGRSNLCNLFISAYLFSLNKKISTELSNAQPMSTCGFPIRLLLSLISKSW